MQDFIDNVFNFFRNIYSSISTYFSNNSLDMFSNWEIKNIFSGDLLYINLTWSELLNILLPTITVFLFIIFIFKLVLKVFGLFRI